MVFPVVMYRFESWTVRKAEHRRSDAFELWCWRRLLRVPWTARRSNQSILKEISPGCSLEALMLKLKSSTLATSCEELIHWKRLWCWEGLGAGGEGDNRGWDGWMASLTRWTWVWVNSWSWWWTWRPGMLQFMGSQSVGHNWATELNWTEPTPVFLGFPCGSAGKESACSMGDLGWEDPLEKGKATYSSILAWRIPWTVESMGSQRVRCNFHFLSSLSLTFLVQHGFLVNCFSVSQELQTGHWDIFDFLLLLSVM